MIRLALAAAVTATICGPAVHAQEPISCEAAREFVLPGEDDLLAETIPWRTTFAQGALEADQQDKPVLLWAMNGHPLGCT
jgi:hypothetical protein